MKEPWEAQLEMVLNPGEGRREFCNSLEIALMTIPITMRPGNYEITLRRRTPKALWETSRAELADILREIFQNGPNWEWDESLYERFRTAVGGVDLNGEKLPKWKEPK